MNGKANASHTHPTTQITDFTEQLNNWGAQANVRSANTAVSANSAGSVPWSGVSGKPSSFTPSSHTHDDRYYTETETNNLLNQRLSRSISGDRVNRCLQDLLNIKVITTDNTGANAVSGLNNYLIFHQAVDIRDAQQMYCFTVGFVNNNKYYYSTVSSKALSIATNDVGTVSVQGGEAAFVKQVFIAIPQIGAATL